MGINRCNDGIIRPLKPDVAFMLPPKDPNSPRPETMPLAEVRALYASFSVAAPPGSPAIELINDVLPGPDGVQAQTSQQLSAIKQGI